MEDTIGRNNIRERFESFGWHTQRLTDTILTKLKGRLPRAKEAAGSPSAIVCDCVKGKGVPYMENNNAWHKGVPSDEEYIEAGRALGGVK